MKTTFPICLLLLFLFSCKENKKEDITRLVTEWQGKSLCILSENSEMVGVIQSFCFTGEKSFVVATQKPSALILYNTKGDQVKVLNQTGSASFEFLAPSLVHYTDEKIYVWCGGLLKLIVYDLNLNPIAEYTGFERAISHFSPYGNLICYMTRGFSDSFIEIYDMDKKAIVHKTGKPTEEQKLLSVMNPSGGMAVSDGGILYYLSPDKLSLKSIDLKNFSDQPEHVIKDKDFAVSPVLTTAADIISNNRLKMIDYLNSNSLADGLFISPTSFIVMASTGKFTHINNKFDSSKRFTKYYVLDKDFHLVSYIKTNEYPFANNSMLTAMFGGDLYCLKEDAQKEDNRYELYMLTISKK